MLILGIGNILQKDDGIGVYASTYLRENFEFSKPIDIVDGGVEGINLLNLFNEYKDILILDTIALNDMAGSIYKIPAFELSGHGLNSGSAHELGVIECIDILELQGKEIPNTTILGIVPKDITFDINLSKELKDKFNSYIEVALKFLQNYGILATKKEKTISLEDIINKAKDPSFSL